MLRYLGRIIPMVLIGLCLGGSVAYAESCPDDTPPDDTAVVVRIAFPGYEEKLTSMEATSTV